MATQIARVGGAVTVEIPEELLKMANIAVGDLVEWTLTPAGSLALHAPGCAGECAVEEGYEEWKLAEIVAGLAEIEAGKWISGEQVREWVQSLGTQHELPPPL